MNLYIMILMVAIMKDFSVFRHYVCFMVTIMIDFVTFLNNGHYGCKTRENSNFLKKGKIVISVKILNFSRSRMTKRISQLESFHEI